MERNNDTVTTTTTTTTSWSEYSQHILRELDRLSVGLEKAHDALREADAARRVIEERTKHVDCEAQNIRIGTIEDAIKAVWKALGGKASWVQVGFVLGTFTVLVGVVVTVILKALGQ